LSYTPRVGRCAGTGTLPSRPHGGQGC